MGKNYSRVLGALMGAVVGDALGAPLIFMDEDTIKKRYNGYVKDMIGGGWLNVAPGETTDDVRMIMAVADGIVEDPKDPISSIGKRFIEICDSKPKNIGICCRGVIMRVKDRGANTIKVWLNAAKAEDDAREGQTNDSGSLVRSVYPALWYDYDKARIIADQISNMTNYHKYCDIAIKVYIRTMTALVARDSFVNKNIIEHYMTQVRYIVDENEIRPNGDVMNDLTYAINAMRDTDNFEDALIQVVNLGGCSSAIGSITGGLAGAYYGIEKIPKRWINALEKNMVDKVEQLANLACNAIKSE